MEVVLVGSVVDMDGIGQRRWILVDRSASMYFIWIREYLFDTGFGPRLFFESKSKTVMRKKKSTS